MPATVFVTKKWLDRNPAGTAMLLAHPDLFELEDHGTAIYDHASIERIQAMGYIVAGFSVNADAGATLPRKAIVARLRAVRPGDIVIAHVNKPGGATAEAFAAALPELLARGHRFVTLYGARLQPQ